MTIHYDEYTLTTKGKEFLRVLYYTQTKGVPVLTLAPECEQIIENHKNNLFMIQHILTPNKAQKTFFWLK